MQIGLVARCDHTGLGYQTRALAEMLNPDVILLIDSSPFKDLKQYPEWYKDYKVITSNGIPGYNEYEKFLKQIDVMVTAETPYVYEAWNWARMIGVKTVCQLNWEFFDGLVQPNMPHPDQYLMPSYWHLEDFQQLFPETIYLPPPSLEMPATKALNMSRTGKKKFVHIVGSNAIYDRNGWSSLIDALQESTGDFELHVFSQQDITGLRDKRIIYHISDINDNKELYEGFDALILPRRYGGLCLPMNEALLAGLPVIMTDIEPNNKILPKQWLLPSYLSSRFEARSTIDVYSPESLADKLDEMSKMSDNQMLNWKQQAYEIGYDNYSIEKLKPKYMELLTNIVQSEHNKE
jgi:glycosyltransferase involved in cell wall biosynthesis